MIENYTKNVEPELNIDIIKKRILEYKNRLNMDTSESFIEYLNTMDTFSTRKLYMHYFNIFKNVDKY